MCHNVVVCERENERSRPSPSAWTSPSTLFQVHRVDESGGVAIRRRLRSSEVLSFFQSLPPCRVGIKACVTAHYWAREQR
jgi:hypothetical protein